MCNTNSDLHRRDPAGPSPFFFDLSPETSRRKIHAARTKKALAGQNPGVFFPIFMMVASTLYPKYNMFASCLRFFLRQPFLAREVVFRPIRSNLVFYYPQLDIGIPAGENVSSRSFHLLYNTPPISFLPVNAEFVFLQVFFNLQRGSRFLYWFLYWCR